MKKYFVVSLVKNGILGGGIVADSEAITYHTGKVTVPKEYRHLEMKYKDIESFSDKAVIIADPKGGLKKIDLTIKTSKHEKVI